MAKQKTHIFIALVLVLLIIAAVTAWLTHDRSDPGNGDPVTTPVPVTTAVPMEPTDTPVTTAEPQETQPAEPTATPAEPTPTPDEPHGTRVLNQSGSFKSDTGTKLNLVVEYLITSKNDSTLSVRVNVYVESYSLDIGSRSGNTIYVNGQGYNFVSNPVKHTSNDSLQKTLITTAMVDVPAEIGETVNIPISVDWHYRGAYSGQEIEHIPAETTVTIYA